MLEGTRPSPRFATIRQRGAWLDFARNLTCILR